MTLFERYLIWAVLSTVFAFIYIQFLMKRTDGRKLTIVQKILYAIFIGIFIPIVILLVFRVLYFQFFG